MVNVSGHSTDIRWSDHGPANPGITVWKCDSHDGVTHLGVREGRPLRAASLDLDDLTVTENHTLPDGYRCLAVEATDDYVYFGTWATSIVHRLERGTGEVSRFVDLPASKIWALSEAPDGTLYAGTANSAEIFEIDPDTGDVDNLGSVATTEKHAFAVHATADTVFVGVGLTDNQGVYEIDRASGESRRVLPDVLDQTCQKIDFNGRYALFHQYYQRTVVVDTESKEGVEYTQHQDVEPIPGICSFWEDGDPKVYYTVLPSQATGDRWPESHPAKDSEVPLFYNYDVESQTHTEMYELPDVIGEHGLNHRSTHIHESSFVGMQEIGSGRLMHLDLETGECTSVKLHEAGMKRPSGWGQSIAEYDGKPVTGRNGGIFQYDTAAGERRQIQFPDEPKTMVNTGDRLYIGMYPGAEFFVYDGSEPERLGKADGQTRPMGMIYHEAADAVVMGTQPGYGDKTGGAVSVLDRPTGDVTTYKNVIEDQTIHSLTGLDSDTLFVGANIRRGNGTDPSTDAAKVGRFDLPSGDVTWREVPVANERRIVWLGHHGSEVYGLTNSDWTDSNLFVVDTDANEVVETVQLDYPVWNMEKHSDGRFYGVVAELPIPGDASENSAGGLVRFDPETHSFQRMEPERNLFSFKGECEVVGDDIYFQDALDWSLKSIEGISEYS
jgi:outer membrane protein assembly factor BamB